MLRFLNSACTRKKTFFPSFNLSQWGLSCSSSQEMPHAASVTGVTYIVTDTQSSQKCHCKRVQHSTQSNRFTIYVPYSAVNISVEAKNAAGFSPAAVVSVGLIPTADLKSEEALVRDGVRRSSAGFGLLQLLFLLFITSLRQNTTGEESEKENLPRAVRVSGWRMEAG